MIHIPFRPKGICLTSASPYPLHVFRPKPYGPTSPSIGFMPTPPD
jgi:hypothetical protein